MKKITLTALLMGLATLSSCSMIPGLTPSVENPLESLEAGVIPTGGEEVDLEQLESIFNDETKEETTLRNGLSIKILNTTFEYSDVSKYNNDGFKEEYNDVIRISNANAEVNLTGLTTATEINQFAASAKANADVYYLSEAQNDYNPYKHELTLSMAAESYVKEGNLYLYLNSDAYKLISGGESQQDFKNYAEIPSEVKDFILEGGLTLPLLSDTNIEFIEKTLEELAKNNDDSASVAAQIIFSEEVLSVAFEHLFTVNKYADSYLLSLDLNKDNVSTKAEAVLDDLYNSGVLNTLIGPAFGTSSITVEQYTELKNEFLSEVSDLTKDFSHAKLSVVFDEVMVKSISVDVDYSYNDHFVDQSFERTSQTSFKLLTNIVFEYSDSVAVSYPDLSGYEYAGLQGGNVESVPPVAEDK